jgi:glycosyltransferase involved in cell wall biosynthesis
LIHELSKYHDVHVLSFVQKSFVETFFDSYEEGLKTSRNHLVNFCKKVEFVPIPCEKIPYGNHLLALKSLFTEYPYSINWLEDDFYKNKLISFIENERYDAVHFDTISLVPYKKYVKNIPTVLDHHNIESHMMLRRAEKEKNIFKRLYFYQEGKRLEKFEINFCHLFDMNITCSDLDSERLYEINPKVSVKTIPNGVDLEYFNPHACEFEKNSLIFVGSMNWYPNVEAMNFFVDSIWPKLKNHVHDCKLHIVGANPPESIQKMAEMDNDIKVHGYVDDIRPYLEKAAIYVCPIRDGGGTKLKILDALAMKKAIVAHPVACEGINVSPGKDVMFAETPDEFVNQILILLKDEQLIRIIGENAREVVQMGFSFQNIGRNIAKVFENLVR